MVGKQVVQLLLVRLTYLIQPAYLKSFLLLQSFTLAYQMSRKSLTAVSDGSEEFL